MPDVFVLDACALIAFLNGEAGAERVSDLFERAIDGEVEIKILAINLCEVFYDGLRVGGEKAARMILETVGGLPIIVEREIDNFLIKYAGKFKVEENLSLADAFALALVKKVRGVLVSTDHHEFDSIVEKGVAQVFWVR